MSGYYTAASECSAWRELTHHVERLRGRSLRYLFADDAERGMRLAAEAAGLYLNYARQRVDEPALDALCRLADQVQLRTRIEDMFKGEPINITEQRAVLHTVLRRPQGAAALKVANENITPVVEGERNRMLGFAEAVRDGSIRGSGGAPFTRVVNIGIGGSDLGPAMAVEALRHHGGGAPRVAFASNVDGNQLVDLLADAEPARTLFIICSKTFTTQETRANALAAREWVQQHLGAAAVPQHFAAVSVNAKAMDEFGVHPDYRFAMWDWVGGRYSLWSSIGVSLAIAIGRHGFEQLLGGAHRMDEHFQQASWRENLPVLTGLMGVWNVNFLRLPTLAVLPYDSRLARLPAYLQQLEMESNGKSVRLDGTYAGVDTCPVIWGEPGNNAQHSFFQLLHQGTPRAALEFLCPVRSSSGAVHQAQHDLAVANCLAQAEAFAFGQQGGDLPPWRIYEGNRPSTLILFQQLDPATLGALIALYEHKVFVQSVLWGINAFDQWGVELGKKLCSDLAPLVTNPAAAVEALSAQSTGGTLGGGPNVPPSLSGALNQLVKWR